MPLSAHRSRLELMQKHIQIPRPQGFILRRGQIDAALSARIFWQRRPIPLRGRPTIHFRQPSLWSRAPPPSRCPRTVSGAASQSSLESCTVLATVVRRCNDVLSRVPTDRRGASPSKCVLYQRGAPRYRTAVSKIELPQRALVTSVHHGVGARRPYISFSPKQQSLRCILLQEPPAPYAWLHQTSVTEAPG